MNPIFTAALEIQAFFHARGWRFCIIGGLAVQRWGEPRLTHDVDCTLLAGLGSEAPYIDGMLEAFASRIEQARAFALTNRVLLIASAAGVPIDVAAQRCGVRGAHDRASVCVSPHRVGRAHHVLRRRSGGLEGVRGP